jgi:hypothetical protein
MHRPNNGYTMFHSKLKKQFNGVFIRNDGTICSNNKVLLDLANFSVKLYELMSYFTINNMQYFIDNFGYEEYINLGNDLYNLKLDPVVYPEYEQIRSVFKIIIEMFYSYITQYKKLQSLTSMTKTMDEQNKILNSIELMRERISQLKKQVNIFDDTDITMTNVDIHTEMIIYIQRYGFPENGVFDAFKIQEIIDELAQLE